jgi:hypothetical protein
MLEGAVDGTGQGDADRSFATDLSWEAGPAPRSAEPCGADQRVERAGVISPIDDEHP